MAQIQGSGTGNWSNTAIVDNGGRLWVNSVTSGTPLITISGGIHIGSVSVDNLYAGSYTYQGTNPWEVIGSMIISALPNIVIDGVKVRGSGLVMFPKEHDRQIQGRTYLTGSSFYDIPSNGSVSILMAVGSCDLHAALDSRSDGDANLILMENVQVTDSGVSIKIINEQRTCGSIMNTTIWVNPTVTTSGDVIHTAMYLGGSGLSTKFTSAAVSAGIHGGDLIFAAGSAYWIKFENLAYRDITYDWNIEMHEHC